MAQIGSLTVDLAAEVATFKKDLSKASRDLKSNTTKMNRALGKLDRGFDRARRGASKLASN